MSLQLGNLAPPDSIVQWFVWFHGQYQFVGILVVMMFIDIATGLVCGYSEKGLSSAVSWRGMGKKVLMLMAVAMGLILQPHSGLPLGQLIAMFYTCTEGISILENMTRAGLPVPQQLRDALEQYGSKQRALDKPASNVTINRANSVDIHAEVGSDKGAGSVVIKTADAPKTNG